MPDDKKNEDTASKRIDPTVEEKPRRPAGDYVVNAIQITARTDDGPAVVLKPGTKLKKDDLSAKDLKRAKASGDVEELR